MDLLLSCFLNSSGLSRAAQEFYRLFERKGLRVATRFITPPNLEFVEKELGRSMSSSSARVALDPVQMLVGIPGVVKDFMGRRAFVGSVVIEGNVLSPRQRKGLSGMDCVMVPTTFCRGAVLRSGYPRKKTFLVPYPLDSSRWNTRVHPSIPSNGRFRFLFMNSWYERKGWDVLLRSWWNEFSADDPVELVIKTYQDSNRERTVEEIMAVEASRLGVKRTTRAPITIIDQQMHDEEIPSFMKSFDALVSPHRSEGFGMNPWYAMALGVPVICTDYGGVTDFAKDDTAWMIPSLGLSSPSPREVAMFPDLAGIQWAEPDGEVLRGLMREVYMDGMAMRQKAHNGAEIVSSQYSGDGVFEDFGTALRESVPVVWEGLFGEVEFFRLSEQILDQPAPRLEGLSEGVRMVEI